MNSQIKTFLTINRRSIQLLLLIFVSAFLMKGLLVPSIAQSTEERVLEDKIPKHLPIKVKIKKEKEKAFKDLNNEKWVRDLELEVTNTGDKPIYLLHMLIVLPGITAPDGIEIGFSLRYGRKQLVDIETKAEPDDVPIKPGETHVFKLSELTVHSWERFRQRENKPDATKLILNFQILSFGDGTGFMSTSGIPIPNPPNQRSRLDRCDPGGMKVQQVSWGIQPTVFSNNTLPARFLLANFLSPESSKPASLKLNLQPQDCCSGTGCSRSKPYVRDCFCDPNGKMRLWELLVAIHSEVACQANSSTYLVVKATARKLILHPAEAHRRPQRHIQLRNRRPRQLKKAARRHSRVIARTGLQPIPAITALFSTAALPGMNATAIAVNLSPAHLHHPNLNPAMASCTGKGHRFADGTVRYRRPATIRQHPTPIIVSTAPPPSSLTPEATASL